MTKATKITKFIIDSHLVYTEDPSFPQEGAILYEGFLYNFIMSHKTETGYSYKVYDHHYEPVYYFVLELGEENNIEIV